MEEKRRKQKETVISMARKGVQEDGRRGGKRTEGTDREDYK